MYGIYYLATPVGGAIGFGIGALLGGFFSWRVAFWAIGFPGILVAILVLFVKNPKSGINDRVR